MESDRKIATSLPPPPPSAPPTALNGANNAFPRVRPMHGRTSGPTRRSTRGQWTPEEDEILRKAVQRFKGKNWKKIAECFKDRTDVQCLHRWQKVLNPELIKGPWSKEEDEVIVQLVNKYGPKKWSTIAQHLPGRIGKQCRERWHNHLNPSINKEAWNQEEELILIRAHQVHGNKWAELTKYLPGRTDNAIKNHWNSSVKKKLDSYIASGLLAQFQGLPMVSHQSQSMPTASLLVQQSSGEGSAFKDGAEVEQNSECSQAGCSQSASDMSNTACQTKEDFLLSEESDHGKLQNTSPTASCSEQYYTEDITFTIPDIPYEFSYSSKYLEDNFSREPGACAAGNSSFGAVSLPNVSMELGADSSSLSGNYYFADPMTDIVPGCSHLSIEYDALTSVHNVAANSDASVLKQKTEEGCSELLLQQEGGDGCPVNLTDCSDIIDMDRFRDYLSFQSIFQLPDASGNAALQPSTSLDTLVEASNCENLSSIPSEVSVENGMMMYTKEYNQINDSSAVSEAQDIANVDEGLVRAYNNSGSPFHDHINAGLTEQTELKEPSRLVPVNTFSPETSDNQQTHSSVVERPVNATCKLEAGSLCYESPRFPYLDLPLYSCDLAQSGNDADAFQEFSPLGIRQMVMSSMNSLTPIWDSPSSDGSPVAVLKSAAKTFACTPSILKKRHRDLLSPLSPFSDRRCDKKTGSKSKQEFLCTSRLTNEFSRLDVMFDEADDCKLSASPSSGQNNRASIEDKENICPPLEGKIEESSHNHAESGARTSEENKRDFKDMEKEENLEQHLDKSVHGFASETHKGVLVERYFSDTQCSSLDGARLEAGSETGDRALEVKSIKITSKQAAMPESMSSKAKSIVSPTLLGQKKQNIDSALSCGQSVSAVTSVMADSLINEVGAENLNIFGGTPFRRSIESPSAWKSPWYFGSLVACSRFDADTMIEDIGIFMSPGDRSYDALGLVKQINEQSAEAYADAREVLGSETPESILRQRCLKNQNLEGESNRFADSQLDNRLHLASNVSSERRVLDFSECETPAKAMEKGKSVTATGLSSPSCLLKSYR
uniref:Transcription factor MYB3R1 n=1 Tax=Oxybasis glauca TaxID=244509 RepID=A0A891LVH8_9CARY|nr:transcription factor MYB3R1 [Oxybasis glauca]